MFRFKKLFQKIKERKTKKKEAYFEVATTSGDVVTNGKVVDSNALNLPVLEKGTYIIREVNKK